MGQALCGSLRSLTKILKHINSLSQDLLLFFPQNAIKDCVYNISGRALSWLVLVQCVSSAVYIWFLINYYFFCFTPNTPQRQASQSWPVFSAGQTHSPCLTTVCQNQPSKWTHNINPSLLFEAQKVDVRRRNRKQMISSSLNCSFISLFSEGSWCCPLIWPAVKTHRP